MSKRYMVTTTVPDDESSDIDAFLRDNGYHWSSHLTSGGRRFEIATRNDVGRLNEVDCRTLAGQLPGATVETY